MAHLQDCQALTTAFSGFGVDEKSIISIAGKWNPEETKTFRKGCSQFFSEDDHHHLFERWESQHMAILEREFARFRKVVVLWAMHPWERDARMVKESLIKGPELYNVIIEIACTRSSEELLGARKAYHSLFYHSMEEDVGYHVTDDSRNLLVALVSSYRYEGPKVNEETAKSETKLLGDAIRTTTEVNPIENEQVLRILTTRSKPFLKVVFSYYKEIYGKTITEDVEHDSSLRETIACIGSPQTYFSEVLDMALKSETDEHTKESLTRIVVCRVDVDLNIIKEEYESIYGVSLSNRVEATTFGNFKDFLLAIIAKAS